MKTTEKQNKNNMLKACRMTESAAFSRSWKRDDPPEWTNVPHGGITTGWDILLFADGEKCSQMQEKLQNKKKLNRGKAGE